MEEPGVTFSRWKRRNVRSKKLEFVRWGSKPLIDFLESIGKDTSKLLKRLAVSVIIDEYIYANNLVNPIKRKQVICDEKLQAIFGKKTIPQTRIYSLLEAHYAEQPGSSADEGAMISSAVENASLSKCEPSCLQNKVSGTRKSCFAALVRDNIKLVYLRRTLVQDLAKVPESFEDKVIGSFVKIKSKPRGHQLHQVLSVKMTSEIHLQLSNGMHDVLLHMLSDANFSQGECEDLCRRFKDGILKRPTVAELEAKAKMLQEEWTKHEIKVELQYIQDCMDHANEKGRRMEFYQYLKQKKELEQPSEQQRRLSTAPKVIPDESEPEATPVDALVKEGGNNSSPKLIQKEIPIGDWCIDFSQYFSSPGQLTSEVPKRDSTKVVTEAASPQRHKMDSPKILREEAVPEVHETDSTKVHETDSPKILTQGTAPEVLETYMTEVLKKTSSLHSEDNCAASASKVHETDSPKILTQGTAPEVLETYMTEVLKKTSSLHAEDNCAASASKVHETDSSKILTQGTVPEVLETYMTEVLKKTSSLNAEDNCAASASKVHETDSPKILTQGTAPEVLETYMTDVLKKTASLHAEDNCAASASKEIPSDLQGAQHSIDNSNENGQQLESSQYLNERKELEQPSEQQAGNSFSPMRIQRVTPIGEWCIDLSQYFIVDNYPPPSYSALYYENQYMFPVASGWESSGESRKSSTEELTETASSQAQKRNLPEISPDAAAPEDQEADSTEIQTDASSPRAKRAREASTSKGKSPLE